MCVNLDQLLNRPQQIKKSMIPMEKLALELPKIKVSGVIERRLSQGQRIAFNLKHDFINDDNFSIGPSESGIITAELRPYLLQHFGTHDDMKPEQQHQKHEFVALVYNEQERLVSLATVVITSHHKLENQPESCRNKIFWRCLLKQKRELAC